jgi:hypothetical protein
MKGLSDKYTTMQKGSQNLENREEITCPLMAYNNPLLSRRTRHFRVPPDPPRYPPPLSMFSWMRALVF